MRVRQFTQDDAHILCTPEQLQDEIRGVLNFVAEVMKIFGFPFEVEVSTRPEKSIGSDLDWERATEALIQALKDNGLDYSDLRGGRGFLRSQDRHQAQGRPGSALAVRHHPVRFHHCRSGLI